jgi:hypothetical protein
MEQRPGIAILLCVSSDNREVNRLRDLMDSLLAFEPGLARFCLFVDDAPDRDLTQELELPATCACASIPNPRTGRGEGRIGGLATGVIAGLSYLHRYFNHVDFVLKLDTDSLIIGPFYSAIARVLAPDVGLVGALGHTCRRDNADYGREYSGASCFIEFLKAVRNRPHAHLNDLNLAAIPGASEACTDIAEAMRNGFKYDEYCQGGGYVISPAMLNGMAGKGYFVNPTRWLYLPFGEDMVVGMYAWSLRLRIVDLSDIGQPFGVQGIGLPYDPEDLLRRGYSIIHSLKDDRYSENGLREFFRNTRRANCAGSERRIAHACRGCDG